MLTYLSSLAVKKVYCMTIKLLSHRHPASLVGDFDNRMPRINSTETENSNGTERILETENS